MEFLEITEDKKTIWDEFVLRNRPESFLQSFAWGEFQQAAGREVFRYAVQEEGVMLCAAQIVQHKLPLGFRYWYLPRGPVMDTGMDAEKKSVVWELLLRHLKTEAKKRGLLFLRMDPALRKEQRGTITELNLNFINGSVQPKDTLILDLGKTEEEMLLEMKQKTRYNVRLAEKKNVQVCSAAYDEQNFEQFWRLIQETSTRDGIVSHGKDYYRAMIKTLGQEDSALKCKLYFAKHEGKIIAANIVLIFGSNAVYLHGASSDSMRNLMAPYLLQWRQIQDAKNLGCLIYDFWGITVDGANPRWEGITRFKKGFGGREVSYVGVCDLPINKLLYALYKRVRKS